MTRMVITNMAHARMSHHKVTALFILLTCGLVCIHLVQCDKAQPGPNNGEHGFQMTRYVKLGPDFKPLYKGRVMSRDQYNLSESAKLFKPEADYYEPGEGPEDDGDDLEEETIAPSSTTTTSAPTTTTTKRPNIYLHSDHVKLGPDFKPLYKGRVINRFELNLTDAAKLTEPKPDYYEPGEGPEDDDDVEEETEKPSTEAPSRSTTSTTTTTAAPSTTSATTSKPYFALTDHITVGPDFKPLYKGKVMSRNDLNLTDSAKKINYSPDYYEPGEGPEDDDDMEDEKPEVKPAPKVEEASPSSTAAPEVSSSTTPSEPGATTKKVWSMLDFYTVGPDFKPLYKGRVIPRYELNLTDSAKKIPYEPDYYEPGEGPADDEDGEDTVDTEAESAKPSSTAATEATRASTSTTTQRTDTGDYVDEKEPEDIDMAVGGISGIVQKIIQGPKSHEINNQSSPEEVYVYLSNIVRDEMAKALKATLPKVYDYQYQVGNLVSQRCLNSFAQFGDRFRRGYVWPMTMLSSSASLSFNGALRDYGDFDRCLDIIADDDERRAQEQFFTGQYCMAQLGLPLPALNKSLNYKDPLLNFNDTEMSGTFGDFVSQNAPFLYSNPLSMGVCVPSSCEPGEIEDVFHFFLKKFHISVKFTVDCYSKLNLTVSHLPGELFDMNVKTMLKEAESESVWSKLDKLTTAQFWALIYILASLVVVALATLYELRQRSGTRGQNWSSSERNRPKSFVACFSARYNLEQVVLVRDRHMYEMTHVQQSSGENDSSDFANPKDFGTSIYVQGINTSVLDGLKALALVWICLANFFFLGYQTQMLPSVVHVREVLLSMQHNAAFQLVTQSWLSMEIFFLLSGFFMAYTALPYIARRDGRPNLLFFVVKRILRFLPSVVFLLLFIWLLPLWKNAGPLYNSGVASILEPCKRFYWRNIFFSSNFYKHEHTCMPQFWYLSVEFQLTLVGIFVTVFAFNRRKHAWKAFILFILLGVIASGYSAFAKRINIAAPIFEKAFLQEIPAIIRDVYFLTPVHFSAYFIGLAIGYYARMNASQRHIPPKILRYCLWIVLPLLTLVALYLPQHWPVKPNFKYGRTATALYYAFFRVAFVSTFAWAVFESIHHRAGVLRSIFSSSIFRILSQLSFQIYLLNLLVIWIYMFTKRVQIQTTLIDMVSTATTLFIITVVLALITYLLFEAPYRSLFRYYLESPRIISFMLPVSQVNGNKPNGGVNFSKGSMLNLNPNFLFSPHYNLVTNISSRAESETSSLANVSIGNNSQPQPTVNIATVNMAAPPPPMETKATNNNCRSPTGIPKSISSVSMVPNGDVEASDFNNNRNQGEAY